MAPIHLAILDCSRDWKGLAGWPWLFGIDECEACGFGGGNSMYTRVRNMDTVVKNPKASLDRLVSLPPLSIAEVPPPSSSTSLYVVCRFVMVVGW